MFLNCSSDFRHPPSLITGFRRFPISRLSSGTMKMLRLPPSFSFPSVPLGTDTAIACCFSSRCSRSSKVPGQPGPLIKRWTFFRFSRVETVGSPVFPCLPLLTLICSPTPTRPPYLTFNDTSVLPQGKYRPKAPVFRYFRGSITYLHQSLSMLRATISGDYARLASGGWLALTAQDWVPAG